VFDFKRVFGVLYCVRIMVFASRCIVSLVNSGLFPAILHAGGPVGSRGWRHLKNCKITLKKNVPDILTACAHLTSFYRLFSLGRESPVPFGLGVS
jgi:hypothetical protein